MINLMYLVLTAMLALNVSAEIIKSFFRLDKSIKHTNEIVDLGVKETIKSMEETVKSKPHLKPLHEAAKTVPDKIKRLTSLINDLRNEITEASGGLYTTKEHQSKWEKYGYKKFTVTTDKEMDGKPVGKKNKDVTTRLLFKEGKGEKLKAEIIKTHNELIAVIEDLVKTADTIDGVKFDKQQIENLKKELVLEIPDDAGWKAEGKTSWSQDMFNQMPVASCYPLLRKFENDANNAAAQIVNFIANNFGTKALVYDQFDVFSQPKKGYIMKGETFEAEIALGAYSSQAEFSVNVNGANIPVEKAKAKYTTIGASVGTQRYSATIKVKNPLTGKEDIVKKDFEFEVGLPSITVSADKMNVFYMGVDNPVSVSAAGLNTADIDVRISGAGGGTITKIGEGKYNIKVTAETPNNQFCSIDVYDRKTGKKAGSSAFRTKRIPDPQAQINGQTDGKIGDGAMKVQPGINAVLNNFDFDAKCTIQSFNMICTQPRQDPSAVITVQGARFDGQAVSWLQKAKPGSVYTFFDIKGTCPGDAVGRKLNGITLTVR
jgi:gliding motility-associated protein GldM